MQSPLPLFILLKRTKGARQAGLTGTRAPVLHLLIQSVIKYLLNIYYMATFVPSTGALKTRQTRALPLEPPFCRVETQNKEMGTGHRVEGGFFGVGGPDRSLRGSLGGKKPAGLCVLGLVT